MSFDPRSRALLRMVYPDLAVRVVRAEQDICRILQLQIRITEAVRTMEYQLELYAKGRRFDPTFGPPLPPGEIPLERNAQGVWVVVDQRQVVTNSPPGFSIHHFGLAIDCCFAGSDPYWKRLASSGSLGRELAEIRWKEYGRIMQAHGLTWGGDWNGNGMADPNDWDKPHVQLTYGYRTQELREFYKVGGMEGVWRAVDKVRKVPEGQDWYGPQSQQRLLEIGLLP